MVGQHSLTLHPADIAPIRDGEAGYARKTVSFCVVFGSSGQFVAVEDLLAGHPAERFSMQMMLPEAQQRDDRVFGNFLWDRYGGFSLAGPTPAGHLGPSLRDAHRERYRSLHRNILAGVTDPPLLTFLKFLDNGQPDVPALKRGRTAPCDAIFVFRFQYDDEFLHERHAARLAWERGRPRGSP